MNKEKQILRLHTAIQNAFFDTFAIKKCKSLLSTWKMSFLNKNAIIMIKNTIEEYSFRGGVGVE